MSSFTLAFNGGETAQPPRVGSFTSIPPSAILFAGDVSPIFLALTSGPGSVILKRWMLTTDLDAAGNTQGALWMQTDDLPAFTVGGDSRFVGTSQMGTVTYPPGTILVPQTPRLVEQPLYRFENINGPLVDVLQSPPPNPPPIGSRTISALFASIASGSANGNYVFTRS